MNKFVPWLIITRCHTRLNWGEKTASCSSCLSSRRFVFQLTFDTFASYPSWNRWTDSIETKKLLPKTSRSSIFLKCHWNTNGNQEILVDGIDGSFIKVAVGFDYAPTQSRLVDGWPISGMKDSPLSLSNVYLTRRNRRLKRQKNLIRKRHLSRSTVREGCGRWMMNDKSFLLWPSSFSCSSCSFFFFCDKQPFSTCQKRRLIRRHGGFQPRQSHYQLNSSD